ncbi:MAG: dihydrofolate reductase family protein [Solirubrobacterales bacterium]
MDRPGQIRRIHPPGGELTTVPAVYGHLGLAELASGGRPWVVANFAQTLDGHSTIEGRSGPIGSDVDTTVLQWLRTQPDAVVIGAGTMRAERYGRMVPDADRRSHRETLGLQADPLAVIVSDSLDLPWDARLFTEGAGAVVVFTSSDRELPHTATPVTVHRSEGSVRLERMLEVLGADHGVCTVVCEGGPTVMGALVAGGLCDELFCTIAPRLAGGQGPRILEGELDAVREAELVTLFEAGGELFGRWRLTRPSLSADRARARP